MKAKAQAEGYARALPPGEGRPPFLVVVDVGRVIELYSEFSRSGATYVPYPDPRSHRIRLEDLAREDIRERLKRVWLDPDALDPAKVAARATREVADDLACIAKRLEGAGHAPEIVAGFLTRCLFTFFAEDVGLLPVRAFETLLADLAKAPAQFVPMVSELWGAMDSGRFSVAIRADVRRFNGKLFKPAAQAELVLPLDRDQIEALHACARRSWSEVEPAIIGTLLERALNPQERHKLGAHYTPRAYVERLVLPTVIEPLRVDWALAQATALSQLKGGRPDQAESTLRHFHHTLCKVRVLDPACGSGNFLYVTLEHLKRLEGEVLNQLATLSGGQQKLETEGLTVDPHQLLGIEVNPRAAALAELVLWIGYLQWHYRTRSGNAEPPLPVLKDYGNIVCRDAVLAWDRIEYLSDERGIPVTRWDGRTMKPHPVTGEAVPDDSARVPVERYVGACAASWPEADFVVGNPPFIGASTMRRALGEGYVDALRGAWPAVPESADFVMYWWHHAAQLTRHGALRRFGFITTNSIKQTFNRRIIEAALAAPDANPHADAATAARPNADVRRNDRGLSLAFAIPDHPWVDAADGAAVRIAMTVGVAGQGMEGRRVEVLVEAEGRDQEIEVTLRECTGQVHADLTTGADLTKTSALIANSRLSFRGVTLMGSGFWVKPDDVLTGVEPDALRPLRNGNDLADKPRGVFAIDFFGLDVEQARLKFPNSFQRLLTGVKPERAQSGRQSYRDRWWIFAEPRPEMRRAVRGVSRYIATSMTARHRLFVFVDSNVLPDQGLIVVAHDGLWVIANLACRVHIRWSLSAGGKLGVGNDPRYNNSRCFEPFPFPALDARDPALIARIGHLGEAIDAHRKRQQAAHPGLTLTGLYNVLEQLRRGATLTVKEKLIHEQGLVSVLASLHDELDAAVLDAYGWGDLAPALVGKPGGTLPYPEAGEAQVAAEAELLSRLVALNAERAAEEARGLIRWLRPEFQDPGAAPEQVEAELDGGGAHGEAAAVARPAKAAPKMPWPNELPAQMRVLTELFASTRMPLDLDAIADRYATRGKWKARLPELIGTLEAIGQIRAVGRGWVAAR
ncbi:MAG: class I SAM-dependent DNA methyltransferase [Gammaproteobacteria bacterium]|nr:class I SAM-dependent DNA methyltransferase [Gammaproteobacteria bacterium]